MRPEPLINPVRLGQIVLFCDQEDCSEVEHCKRGFTAVTVLGVLCFSKGESALGSSTLRTMAQRSDPLPLYVFLAFVSDLPIRVGLRGCSEALIVFYLGISGAKGF